jgi:hypothetical protein
MSEAMAHLLSAHAAIDELAPAWPLTCVPLDSLALASRSVDIALRELDERGVEVWREAHSTNGSHRIFGDGWPLRGTRHTQVAAATRKGGAL